MFTVIPRSITAQIVLVLIAAVTIVISALVTGNSFTGTVMAVSAAVGPVLLVLYGLFGLCDERWSVWRMLWKKYPALNHLVYPDLNGVWVGQFNSNFSVIERLAKGAWDDDGHIDISALDGIELQHGPVALLIRASFFRIEVEGVIPLGRSNSTSARVRRSTDFELEYIYEQRTSDAASTDEGTHLGAAIVRVSDPLKPQLQVDYWTRRRWRQGLNTAGTMSLKRFSTSHGDLADALNEASNLTALT